MSNHLGKITTGSDPNFFSKTTISNTEFTDNASVVVNVRWLTTFSFTNEGSNVLEYSFNGNTMHGDLTPDTPTEHLVFEKRPIVKVWFRAPSGNSIIRVEGWSNP